MGKQEEKELRGIINFAYLMKKLWPIIVGLVAIIVGGFSWYSSVEAAKARTLELERRIVDYENEMDYARKEHNRILEYIVDIQEQITSMHEILLDAATGATRSLQTNLKFHKSSLERSKNLAKKNSEKMMGKK